MNFHSLLGVQLFLYAVQSPDTYLEFSSETRNTTFVFFFLHNKVRNSKKTTSLMMLVYSQMLIYNGIEYTKRKLGKSYMFSAFLLLNSFDGNA